MTEQECRPEEDGDEPRRLDPMASAADAFETRAEAPRRTPTSDRPQPPSDSAEFERQMTLGRASMRKHREVLAALAK